MWFSWFKPYFLFNSPQSFNYKALCFFNSLLSSVLWNQRKFISTQCIKKYTVKRWLWKYIETKVTSSLYITTGFRSHYSFRATAADVPFLTCSEVRLYSHCHLTSLTAGPCFPCSSNSSLFQALRSCSHEFPFLTLILPIIWCVFSTLYLLYNLCHQRKTDLKYLVWNPPLHRPVLPPLKLTVN